MHSGIILLAVCSLALIVLMVTCFVCFIRSRRKEDEEFMQQVQLSSRQQQEFAGQGGPVQSRDATLPSNLQAAQAELLDDAKQAGREYAQVIGPRPLGRQSPYSAAAAAYAAAAASPYHGQARAETRSDITQQINAAIIGSSEAEFQNDFIQVFPMYQIAPQPEKNTTPYLT